MKLKQKIILFAVIPLLLVLGVIALTVHHQAVSLGEQQHEVIKSAYLATKDAELKNYVALARRSIAHLYESGRTDDNTREEAKAILAKLEYGDDGYFFLFDTSGNLLMHPRQTERMQQNFWDYKDPNGKPIIRELVQRARDGGGFEDYVWEKPSRDNASTRKRAYVVELPDWGWMLGTGVYLDDVDEALNSADIQVSRNIFDTMRWIIIIALLSVALVVFSGWMLNIRERRDAISGERKRIARELHDGICQRLAAAQLQSERQALELMGAGEQCDSAPEALRSTAAEIRDITDEVREIAHGLYPEILIKHGLVYVLRQHAHRWSAYFPGEVEFAEPVHEGVLPIDISFALYRVAQEALKNSRQHAHANRVFMQLKVYWRRVELMIADDGVGLPDDFTPGIGLTGMKERLEEIGGKLSVTSSNDGTVISAMVPRC